MVLARPSSSHHTERSMSCHAPSYGMCILELGEKSICRPSLFSCLTFPWIAQGTPVRRANLAYFDSLDFIVDASMMLWVLAKRTSGLCI